MHESHQAQQESVKQMQKELMDAISKQQEQASLKASQQEEEMTKKYESYVNQAKQGEDLMRTNQNLSETISNVEERNR